MIAFAIFSFNTIKYFLQVTYKWLSKELEIHVNAAKDILKQYWEKFKDKETLVATYLLIGQLKDRSIRVEVVKDSNLNIAKEKFVKIDCQHFYSLQKCSVDLELLAACGEDLRYSAIKCNEEYIRNEEEVENLRYVGNSKRNYEPVESTKITNKVPQKQSPTKNDSTKKKNSTNQNSKKEKVKSSDSEGKTEESKLNSKIESEESEKKVSPPVKTNNNSKTNNKISKKPVQSKQSGFSNLFGKAVNAKSAPPKKSVEDFDDDSKESSSNCSEKKDTKKSQDKEESKKSQEKEDKNIIVKEKENNKSSQNKDKNNLIQEKTSKKQKTPEKSNKVGTKNDTAGNKQKGRGKKRNRSQDNNASSKRKRIIVMDSSEDESNQSDEEQEEEPMDVEEEQPKVIKKRSQSPPTEKRENGKRMVRKTVEKTFKDEEGYFVTKKVHVYEVASDNDETEIMKEEPAKPKPVEKQKKKQTSLMSFFKKN